MNENKRYKDFQDEFVKLYTDGMSLRAIAKLYNVNKGVVSNFVRQKVDIRPKSTFSTKKSAQKVYDMYLKLYTTNAIAKNLNVSNTSIVTALRNHYNIIVSDRTKFQHLLNNFIEDYKQGASLKEIADKYGVNKSTVNVYLTEAGIETRSYEETSRKYPFNQEYFNELNEYKSEQLGALFAIGTSCIYNVTHMTDIVIYKDYKEILTFIIKDMFFEDTPKFTTIDNSIRMRISSNILYNTLANYGLCSKINIPKSFKESFIKGYFKHSLTINSRTIRIALFFESYTPYIVDYLESIGINKTSITIKEAIYIERKKELFKLINKNPEILEKIQKYNELKINVKWNKILKDSMNI